MTPVPVRVQTLDELYDEHSKTVYFVAYQRLRDRELAADVMQNVFLSAYRHMEKISQMSDEQRRAWLYRSAINGSIDALRRTKRLVSTEDAGLYLADPSLGPDDEAIKSDTRRAVREALMTLPDKYKEPLILYYFAQMDYKQISVLLKLNEGTLKSRMSRGRGLMEKILRKGGGFDG